MSAYNYSAELRQVLAAALEEARALHHNYVGTEHLLLGLLRRQEGSAAAVLAKLDIDPAALRAAVLSRVPAPGRSVGADSEVPYSSRAKRALELTMIELRLLGHPEAGPEHLLLGLLAEGNGIAAQAGAQVGLTLDRAREAVI